MRAEWRAQRQPIHELWSTLVGVGLVLTGLFSGSCHRPASPLEPEQPEPTIVFNESSPYGQVIVVDQPYRRCLKFSLEGGEQTCVDPEAPNRVIHEYVKYLSVGLVVVPRAPKTLMVGLGGGASVRMYLYHEPGLQMEVVEINPTVVRVAREYFGIAENRRLKIHVADGRAFLQQTTSSWNLIVLDAYGDGFVPFPLVTKEFLTLVRSHLSPDGAAIANLWTRNRPLFHAMLKTYQDVFDSVFVFECLKTSGAIVVATNQQPELTCPAIQTRASRQAGEYRFSFDFEEAPSRCKPVTAYDLSEAPTLADAHRDEFDALGKM